ncbi:MAG TPA: TRAP transporter large permease [Denitromonas sp.]|uniref:TRAP transporter large permease n=1 Tax=Denitromonas sp. TaxID=2734609 RepID=UPI001DFEA1A9|nr:TRAP transporter large permease [Rhodocyclaceae bacterium]MCP5233758.1 TRAP transporter large permease [Zoogloeaceae bacterium]HPR07353.1 TRAP transporter large permease [Denitromonas sp.]HQU86981.1 TRAP transporter large permease [Denitromonas sp.]HQV13268.1 TRAP transporter large permease [Denitromonas sp.]
MALTIILVMLVLLLLGYPMIVPMLVATFVGFFVYFPMLKSDIIVQQMISGISPVALITVPMFILAADIVTRGHTANRLLDLAMTFFGHIKGGLAVTTAVACTLFGAISGSTQATVVAIGGPIRPRMLQAGYDDRFTTALIINASDIAFLIPPSIGMIVFGIVGKVSIGELFLAGIGPGLLILVLFSIYSVWYAWRNNIPLAPRIGWADRLRASRKASLALMFPVLIIGGLYAGYFSPTEVAAIAVLYAFILEVCIYRAVKLKDIPRIAYSTGLITGIVFVLVGTGAAFSWIISFAQLPQQLIASIGLADAGPYTILFVISLSFFVGCMFVDPIVVTLILTPIFMPLVNAAGIDPVLVGTLVTLQMAIGSCTPPFGCDIFTACAIFRKPYLEVIAGTPPFIIILLLAATLLVLVPDIALLLPRLAFH